MGRNYSIFLVYFTKITTKVRQARLFVSSLFVPDHKSSSEDLRVPYPIREMQLLVKLLLLQGASGIALPIGYYSSRVGRDYVKLNPIPTQETVIDDASIPLLTEVSLVQNICLPGAYCLKGYAHLCEAGHFGTSSGLSDPECEGHCDAGFYCPQGSTSSAPPRRT